MGGGAPDVPPEALAAEAPSAPQDSAAPTAEALAKAAPPEVPAAERAAGAVAPIVPQVWLLALGVLAVLAVGLSLYLDHLTRRKFRSRLLEK
jgi:hypothetical protein